MRALVGLAALIVISAMLAEFFIVFLLPRRVKRDLRIARRVLRWLWVPWRGGARLLPRHSADTLLGIFGPLSLLTILATLSAGMIAGFAGLHYANATHLGTRHAADFGGDLFYSAAAFFSASTSANPSGAAGKLLQVLEAANGFAFLAIAIGYLPALFQAFSRRETAVSRLDPLAGSPPTVGALLVRSAGRGGWKELDRYLQEWESWTAELMETHLSYPVLAYFRSQHVNQNWLAALTAVVDACAYAIAYGPEEAIDGAELTFRLGRHALADLALTLSPRMDRTPLPGPGGRLTPAMLAQLRSELDGSGLHSDELDDAPARLNDLRAGYEHYALALSNELALQLPGWVTDEVQENWRSAHGRGGRRAVS